MRAEAGVNREEIVENERTMWNKFEGGNAGRLFENKKWERP